MKTIKLTPTEFLNSFKLLAKFYYKFAVSSGMIVIEADAELLKAIGY